MQTLKLLSLPEQIAAYMRTEILRGTWSSEMPGAPKLATEFGVDHRMIISALRLLEKEGLLAPQGAGRRRKVVIPDNHTPPALRVQTLLYEKDDNKLFHIAEIQHRLLEMGHVAGFPSKSQHELGMDVKRIARLVQSTEADAWVVMSGSREVLEWFAQQSKPAIALAGRQRGVAIACSAPDKVPALREAVRRLADLRHRRIVMLTHAERRNPNPGFFERSFFEELDSLGIATGPYNLPDWQDDMTGFHRCLDSLFMHTPPTALLIDGTPSFIAAQLHLAQRGILAPRDVSLICFDPDPAFSWCQPSVAHIHWDTDPIVRRIVGWADNVARGKIDRRKSYTKATFIEGGTMGPAPVR